MAYFTQEPGNEAMYSSSIVVALTLYFFFRATTSSSLDTEPSMLGGGGEDIEGSSVSTPSQTDSLHHALVVD